MSSSETAPKALKSPKPRTGMAILLSLSMIACSEDPPASAATQPQAMNLANPQRVDQQLCKTDALVFTQFTPAYASLIELAIKSSGPLQANTMVSRALNNVPDSYAIRLAMLAGLEPKWGGSLAAMDRLLSDTRKHEASHPELAQLRAYRSYTEANIFKIASQYDAYVPERVCRDVSA